MTDQTHTQHDTETAGLDRAIGVLQRIAEREPAWVADALSAVFAALGSAQGRADNLQRSYDDAVSRYKAEAAAAAQARAEADHHRGVQIDNARLKTRIAELERKLADAEDAADAYGTADAASTDEADQLRLERDRLQRRLREVRAVTADWHQAAVGQTAVGQNGWTIAGHALAMVLAAIDDKPATSDADESGHDTGGETVPNCACGAPAAFGVGYQGEGATVFQCTRCATADRRTPFFHRDVQSYTVHTCGPTPNGLVCACGGPVNHEGAGRDAC